MSLCWFPQPGPPPHGYCDLFPLLICNFLLQQQEARFSPPAIYLIHYSVPDYRYAAFRTVSYHPEEKELYGTETTVDVQYIFPLGSRCHSFPKLLRSASFAITIHSEFFPYISNTVRLFATSCIPLKGRKTFSLFKFLPVGLGIKLTWNRLMGRKQQQ